MEISTKLLTTGASARGGYTKKQTILLGLPWPLPHGWKNEVIGKTISDENAQEFVRLANRPIDTTCSTLPSTVNWFNAQEPVAIYLYVHALEDGCFYVGLTANLEARTHQHFNGDGAQWTKLHRPLQLLHSVCTGTTHPREAEKMEDETTVILMLKYGIEKVRGGHFCHASQAAVEAALNAHGFWDRIKQTQLSRCGFESKSSWSESLDNFLDIALRYYDAGAPKDQRDAVFSACYQLTRFSHWHADFEAGLSWQFWNCKGVLPVLLSFKHARTVGSRLARPFDVLAAALNRGKDGNHPLRRVFLLAWQAYQPPTTENQQASVTRYMRYLNDGSAFDRQYDAFISVLLPKTRHLLRSQHVGD
jgi:predicted GIY-YIG superfamily endonuclease